MNDGGTTGPARDLRDEAADWFVRMREPDDIDDRAEFERWLAADPLHRDAYNRIAEVFSYGKKLAEHPALVESPPPPSARSRVLAIACVFAVFAAFIVWRPVRHTPPSTKIAATTSDEKFALTTPVGSIRNWRLEDGTQVTLDTDSAMLVAFTPTARAIRLMRGRVRFDVAHEARPFQVFAGAGTVTAHGTLFDVRIQPNHTVSVRLIRGAIDVALTNVAVTPHMKAATRERLGPGQQLVFDTAALLAPRTVAAPADARWPEALLDCDHATLAAIVAEADRYSATHIIVPDPSIGALRVSGSFRIDDPPALARRLATLFDLTLVQDSPRRLLLSGNRTRS
jgi:transmembrane sensor